MQQSITIPANGSAIETMPGKFLTILSAQLPFVVSFNGAGNEKAQDGQIFERKFKFINFVNPNSIDISVTYDVGQTPASVQQNQKPASTYAVGNSTTSLSNGDTLSIPDGNNGNQRQQITISVNGGSEKNQGSLNLLDSNGNVYDQITLGQTKTYVLGGALTVKAIGNVSFYIGENYYNS